MSGDKRSNATSDPLTVLNGDCREMLRTLPDASVHCVVTSPPYFGLRDYQVVGQIGLEQTPDAYVAEMVAVFREIRRVLHPSGTAWLNLGDSYAGSWGNQGRKETRGTQRPINGPMLQNLEPYPVKASNTGTIPAGSGLKPKDLIGIPWRVALALQADGWWLRQDIVWAKKAPMPESVTDRFTRSHEYVFMLAKAERYYFDQDAVAESAERGSAGSTYTEGKTGINGMGRVSELPRQESSTRNKRDVWLLGPEPFSGSAYDFSTADYVDDRGIPRRWFPDCPVHEQDGRPRQSNRVVVFGGEQEGGHLSRSGHSDDRLAPTPSPAAVPKDDCTEKRDADSRPEGFGDSSRLSKTSDRDPQAAPQKDYRSPSIQELGVQPNSDSSLPATPDSANASSIQSRRTDPAPSSSERDTACEETTFRIPRTELPASLSAPLMSIDESSRSEDGVGHEPENDTRKRTSGSAGKYSRSYNDYKCSCMVSEVRHFAVMPTALVEPCILAGSSEKGCCPECLAPWRRVVERTPMLIDRSDRREQMGEFGRTQSSGTMVPAPSSRTVGWEPTCSCGAPDGWLPDDGEVIDTPTGERVGEDPSMTTGRGGMNRPRGDNEGSRPITRYEQRQYARQLRLSPHRAQMEREAGEAFAHYIRTDRSGARPVPPDLLESWLAHEWLERVRIPQWTPLDPIPCTVLDPFAGSGTTLRVAVKHRRRAIGIELNPEYCKLIEQRIVTPVMLPLDTEAAS